MPTRPGTWLQPRHMTAEAFEKDFPIPHPAGLDVYCPGCKGYMRLNRKSTSGRMAGWCRQCQRGVSP